MEVDQRPMVALKLVVERTCDDEDEDQTDIKATTYSNVH